MAISPRALVPLAGSSSGSLSSRLDPPLTHQNSIPWSEALDQWLSVRPQDWLLPESPAQIWRRLIANGFIAEIPHPAGCLRTRLRVNGSLNGALSYFDSHRAVLAGADEIEVDWTTATASPAPGDVAAVMDECFGRFGARPSITMRLDQLPQSARRLERWLQVLASAPVVAIQCDGAAASALGANAGSNEARKAGHNMCADGCDHLAGSIAAPHQLAALLCEAMAPGATVRIALGDGARPVAGASPAEALPRIQTRSSVPLPMRLAPAIEGHGLAWEKLGAALRDVAALAPALAGAWMLAVEEDLKSALGDGCPLALSFSHLEALFEALGTAPGETRARQWASDVMQFARVQVARAASECGVGQPGRGCAWEYRPEAGALVPEAGALSGQMIQTQMALQAPPRSYPIRVGFRSFPGIKAETLLRAMARGALFGAQDLWMVVGGEVPAGGDHGLSGLIGLSGPAGPTDTSVAVREEYSQPESASAPVANHDQWIPVEVRVSGSGALDNKRLSLSGRGDCLTEEAGILCYRCDTPMRLTAHYLWCPRCRYVLAGT